jgi:hypothetical protein
MGQSVGTVCGIGEMIHGCDDLLGVCGKGSVPWEGSMEGREEGQERGSAIAAGRGAYKV